MKKIEEANDIVEDEDIPTTTSQQDAEIEKLLGLDKLKQALEQEQAKLEAELNGMTPKDAVIARCKFMVYDIRFQWGISNKKAWVQSVLEGIQKERKLGRFTAPDSTICDWLIQNCSKIFLDCSPGYIRQVLPDKYKNANQGKIANLQLKGIAASRVRWDRRWHPKKYIN
jgi:hypothetical protein